MPPKRSARAVVPAVHHPIRLAILGGGAVTWEFYLPALTRITRHFDIVSIVDPSPLTANRLRNADYTGLIETDTAERFLRRAKAKRDIQAVIVALPNALHESVVMAALESGLHVLCEKPLALTSAACRRMEHAAEKAGKHLAVGMVRRKTAGAVALREALEANLIGALKNIRVEDGETYQWMSESGTFFDPASGGLLADMGVHYLDLIQWFAGPLTPLDYDDDWQGGCEANLYFKLETKSGIPVEMRLSRDRQLSNELILQGRKGELIARKSNFSQCFWKPKTMRPASSALTAVISADKPFVDESWPTDFVSGFSQQLVEFAQAIRGDDPKFPTAKESTSTIALIEWAYQQREKRSPAKRRVTPKPEIEGPVLVTGGSGFIGSCLVSRLALSGTKSITVPVRNYRSCVDVARFPVHLPRVNLLDRSEVQRMVHGNRYVIHLAYGREGADSRAITVKGTEILLEAAIEAKVEAVVILSTMNVFGFPSSDEPVDEKFPYAPETEYGRAKAEMEKGCLKRAASSGNTRIVILNPSCVYGPRGKTYTRLPLDLCRRNEFCWINDGRGIANYTYIDNLLDAIVLAAKVEAAHGQRFIINDGSCFWKTFLSPLIGGYASRTPSLTPKELLSLAKAREAKPLDLVKAVVGSRELRDVVGRMPHLGRVKQWAGKTLPGLRSVGAPSASAVSNVEFPAFSPPLWLLELFGPTSTRFSGDRARAVLGWEPKVDLIEGQKRTKDWLSSMRLLI